VHVFWCVLEHSITDRVVVEVIYWQRLEAPPS
jgi:hypothetical protein